MSNLSYEEAKKKVFLGFWILLGVTLFEVFISLFGKGYMIESMKGIGWIVGLASVIIVGLSIYKAKYIIDEFMHMGYEVRGLRTSVLLPTALLIWAIIAFFQEGNSWKERREQIQDKNEIQIDEAGQQGMLLDKETYIWKG